MSSSDHILAVDVGSSSVRCSLYDSAGGPVEGTEASRRHEFTPTRDGGSVLDPDELLGRVAEAIDASLAGAGEEKAECIAAVATSTFWHSVLGVDGGGHPTTPILTWADRRAAGAAGELRERLDEGAVHGRTGCLLQPSYLPAKLLWLSRSSPDAFSRTERFLSPGEYLYLKLFGEARVGTSMASGTGLLDLNGRTWDGGLLDVLPIEEGRLSPISDEPHEGLRGEWARRWPALADVPWFPAAGDGACSNVGSGCVGRDRLAVMIGTSGAMRMLWRAETIEVPEGLWCYRSDPARFVAGGALSDGGNLVDWLRDTLRLPEPEETEEMLVGMQPGAHGLAFLPLLAGERGPGWAGGANGAISGLSMATRPVEILRAAMEAVALRFALIAEKLDEAFPYGEPNGEGRREIVATGGALLNSSAWTRIVTDALGKPVTVSEVREASRRGAALLALESLGELEIEGIEAPMGKTHEPDPEHHARYMEALERQQGLYEALVGNG